MSKLAPADQTFGHLSKRGEADVLMLRLSDSMVLFDGENAIRPLAYLAQDQSNS
jgi:hypothetical protein